MSFLSNLVLVTEKSKNSGPILGRLWTKVHAMLTQCTPCTFQCSIVYIMRHSEDIRY